MGPKVKCPICGSDQVFLVAAANGVYPPSFRCYSHGEHTFSNVSREAYEQSARSLASSAVNAASVRRERR